MIEYDLDPTNPDTFRVLDDLSAARTRIAELEAENAREHQQRLGDVESWTHWRNKYEDDTYALREQVKQAESRLQAALEALRPFARVHAGAETARRVLVGAIEGPDRFHDPVVVVFLRDALDALDGGGRRQGLLAMGDTPEERIAKGRRILAAQEEGS